MAPWLRAWVMAVVLTVWAGYITAAALDGGLKDIPDYIWMVPGATYALLSNRLIRITRTGVEVGDKEKREPDE